MKRGVIFSLLCAGLSVGCQPSSRVPPNSGIEFKLSSPPDGAPALRPDGLFRVQGLDVRRSVYVPLTPIEPGSTAQRIELPPGSYRVSYVPVELDASLHSLRRRDAVESVSHDTFRVVVSKGKFSTVNVRAVDAAGSQPTPEQAPSAGAASRSVDGELGDARRP